MGTAREQGRLWTAVADDWARLVEPYLAPAYLAVLDAVGPRRGVRLFDGGCGAGLALCLAAARGAEPAGLDASPRLPALAHRRLPAADLREGELEALPYPDGSFTAVTTFDAVPYVADPLRAVRELRRVAVPPARRVPNHRLHDGFSRRAPAARTPPAGPAAPAAR